MPVLRYWFDRMKKGGIAKRLVDFVMAFTQIPQAISAALLGMTDNQIIILLIMNVILLISGTFMAVTYIPAVSIGLPMAMGIM